MKPPRPMWKRTADRIALIHELYAKGMRNRDIAAQIGISVFALSHFVSNHNLPKNPNNPKPVGRKRSPHN